MIDPTNIAEHRLAKRIEKYITKGVKKEGYEFYVRKFLHHFFEVPYSRDSTTALAWSLGILVRMGCIPAGFVHDLFGHLGIIIHASENENDES